MPTLLTLILVIVAMVVWVGFETAMTMGDARVFKVAVKQHALYLLLLALPAVLVGLAAYLWWM